MKDTNKSKNNNKKLDTTRLTRYDVRTEVVKIEELEKLSVEKQEKYFEDVFNKIYDGKEVESLRKYSLRCIKLTCDPKNNKIHLPYGVLVQKKDDEIIIKTYRNRHLFLMVLFFTLLLLALLWASYKWIDYSIVKNLNKDIDGDGIPELNLDLNGDRKAEINIDTVRDGKDKPNLNIDYKGNRKAVFNIDRNKDGKPDFNLINQKDKNGKCYLNCDTNDDGWPDINLDLDGDGIADMEIDTDGDGRPDLNFDMNGDMKCDLHCDTNNDLKCDEYCLKSDELENVNPVNSGSSTNVGNKDLSIKSGELILEYEDQNTVFITDIYPDDQPNYIQDIPTKRFKVTNKSNLWISYNLRWVVTLNDYVTDNFKYKIASTRNGANFDFRTAPKETAPIATKILIAPGAVQEYAIDFKLQGTGGKQNEDQGRTFSGHVEIYLDNEY